MAQTAIYNFQKPDGTNNVDEEFYQLQETLDLLDSILAALQTAVNGKSATGHAHAISDVINLASELAAKMPASTTFKLDDLTDVSGADGAPNNYVLVKSALGWLPSSALAALGTHGHLISEITGLVAALADKADAAATSTALAGKADAATAVTLAGTQTLTNKTLTDPVINARSATFALFNAAGTPRKLTFDTTALTADRVATFPDRAVDYSSVGQDLGRAQTWQDVTGSRATGTTYQNTTGRAIALSIAASASGSTQGVLQVSTDGSTWVTVGGTISDTSGAVRADTSFTVVPPAHYYRWTAIAFSRWMELR